MGKKMDVKNENGKGIKQPIAPVLKELAIGAEAAWPLARANCVRNAASVVALQTGKTFRCTSDRATHTITVRRMKNIKRY